MSAIANRRIGNWECDQQASALAYLVKFSPDAGGRLLERALAARGPQTGCYSTLFRDIAEYTHEPVLTQIALAAVNDEEPQVASNALDYLTAYGDKTAEKPILACYRKWHEQWAGNESELDQASFPDRRIWDEIGLGQTLGRAVLASQGWLADSQSIQLAKQVCVGKQVCEQVDGIALQFGPPFHITINADSRGATYSVAQYKNKSTELLEEKLAQFPRGTKFDLDPAMPRTSDERELEEKVIAILKRQGMILAETKKHRDD